MKQIRDVIIITVLLAVPVIAGIKMKPVDNDSMNHGTITAYPEHLDGPLTGGFGENSCHSCHFDYDINPEEGSFRKREV